MEMVVDYSLEMAVVGNGFYAFIRAQFRSHNSFTKIEDIFSNVLKKNEILWTECKITSSLELQNQIEENNNSIELKIDELLQKFVEYYLQTRFNDYTKAQLPRLNCTLSGRDNSALESLPFVI